MKQILKKFSKDNRGVSLITVIITVTFLAVLGTMLIGAALVNFKMKQMDQRSKKDFYTAETALDDVYNGLGKDITTAIAASYEKAMMQSNAQGFISEEAALAYLRSEFVSKFQNLYDSGHPIGTAEFKASLLTALNEYIVTPATGIASVEDVASVEVGAENAYVALRGVVVNYDNSTLDTTSTITTDIVLTVPTLRFFDSHDYIWDYALIGNKGIFVKDGSIGTNLNGNVYGGSSTDSSYRTEYGQKDVYGGINVKDTRLTIRGETIISGADFNINSAQLSISGLSGAAAANLWTGNLNVAGNGSTVDANGSLFLNNDLEINGTNAQVTLGGNYYGYSNNSVTKESQALGKEHAQSSSILVNGRNNTLNLEALDLLLISGRSYLDFTGHGNSGEYGTGEAISLRTSQFIYMVPTEFLEYANPETAENVGSAVVKQFTAADMQPAEWFGWQYLNQTEPVRQEVMEVSGKQFVYFFLNFRSPTDERDYVNAILNATPADTQAYALKYKMQERIGVLLQDSMILRDGAVNCNVYSNFGVMQYTEGSGSTVGSIQAVDSGSSGIVNANLYAAALNNRYSYLLDTLDPKPEVALDQNVGTSPNAGQADLPLSGFVFLDPNTAGYNDLTYNFSSNGSGIPDCYKGVISRNGYSYDVILSKEDLSFNGNLLDFHGVILTTGNISMRNCAVDGLVMAKGTVTLQDTQISANRELLLSIIEAESLEINNAGYLPSDEECAQYFIHYLKDPRYNGSFPYGKDSVGADYTQFITYENWKKGDVR